MSDIAINPVTRRVQFTGNTGTGPYAFTFNILVDGDIAVFKGTTELTLTTDYTVSINANGTGSITLAVALIASDVLTIIGGRELSRTTDFVTAGDLLASSLNEQLDSNVIMTQQLDEKLGRGLFVNPGDVFTDLELPLKDDRKGTVLGFNATTGDPEPGPEIADVDSLANISADIKTLAEIQDGTVATDAITNVNTIRANVTTVSGISGNVTTVAGISSDVTTVAADGTDIGIVAGSISNVNNVGGSISNVNTVAGSISNVNTVSGDIADVNTVAGISSDVSTVSGISADVTTVAADGTDIGVVAGISSDVTTVSGISANVTTVAGINAAVSTVAADQADIGVVSTNIASVNTVSTNIASVNTNTANITAIQNASANASAAATSASNAATSESNAATSESNAATSASDADTARIAAEAALDEFTDIYLGAKASDPTTDNDGNALTAGDQYFNTTLNVLKIYNGSAWQAAAIDSSGFVETTGDTMTGPLDVQSTITSDGLTVDGAAAIGANATKVNFYSDSTYSGIYNGSSLTSDESIYMGGDSMFFYAAGKKRLDINSGGDLSLYEDTGTTPKFFWDASAESLGIGTSSPATSLHVDGAAILSGDARQVLTVSDSTPLAAGTGGGIAFRGKFSGASYTQGGFIQTEKSNSTSGNFAFDLVLGSRPHGGSPTERMRIDSSGNVGIGVVPNTTNYGDWLFIGSAGNSILGASNDMNMTANAYYNSNWTYGTSTAASRYQQSSGKHIWSYAASGTAGNTISFNEAMRIDSSGNLLVGTTDSDPNNNSANTSADDGFAVTSNVLRVAKYNDNAAVFNRTGSDGAILQLRKSGITVGSIGVGDGDNLYISGHASSTKGLYFNDDTIGPAANGYNFSDNTTNLGAPSYRFKDLYLSGTIEIENGTGNVGVGKNALRINTASNNTAVGYQAAYSISTSANNTIMGYQAGYSQATGSGANALFGIYAGNGATSTYNTMIGPYAGYLITSGDKNTILGGYSGNQGGLDIRTSSNNIVLSDGDGNPRLYIDSSGRNLIGQTASAAPAGGAIFQATQSNNNWMSMLRNSASSGAIYGLLFTFGNQAPNNTTSAFMAGGDTGAERFRIYSNGNIVNQNNSYGAISDVKLKENIVDAASQWDDIKALTVRKYSMKLDNLDAPNRLGVIAQEVEAAGMGGLVFESPDKDADNNDLGTVTKQVNYSILYMKAVKALQEAMDRIETLEAKVTALENA